MILVKYSASSLVCLFSCFIDLPKLNWYSEMFVSILLSLILHRCELPKLKIQYHFYLSCLFLVGMGIRRIYSKSVGIFLLYKCMRVACIKLFLTCFLTPVGVLLKLNLFMKFSSALAPLESKKNSSQIMRVPVYPLWLDFPCSKISQSSCSL